VKTFNLLPSRPVMNRINQIQHSGYKRLDAFKEPVEIIVEPEKRERKLGIMRVCDVAEKCGITSDQVNYIIRKFQESLVKNLIEAGYGE